MAWGDFTNPEAWKQAMAGLLRRGGEVGEYVATAPQKAGQAIIDAGQRQSALMNEAFDPTGKTLIRNPQAANQAAMNLFEGPLSFAPAGITAWHGSPHTFEKFDMSKVGTGEGAQAYGHGMYFAEAPEVARTYATSGKYETANDYAQHFLAENKGNKDLALKALNNEVAHFDKNGWTADISKDMVKDIEKSIKNGVQGSNLYKVDIPDEHIPMMLDYDAPIKNQPEILEKVRGLIKDPDILKSFDHNVEKGMTGANVYTNWIPTGVNKNALYKQRDDLLNKYMTKDMRMSDAVRAMTPDDRVAFSEVAQKIDNLKNKPKIVSQVLNDIGIKGIKYLDQGSRGKGGTSNFVVFDPTDVKILERNNQPLTRKELLEEQVNKLK